MLVVVTHTSLITIVVMAPDTRLPSLPTQALKWNAPMTEIASFCLPFASTLTTRPDGWPPIWAWPSICSEIPNRYKQTTVPPAEYSSSRQEPHVTPGKDSSATKEASEAPTEYSTPAKQTSVATMSTSTVVVPTPAPQAAGTRKYMLSSLASASDTASDRWVSVLTSAITLPSTRAIASSRPVSAVMVSAEGPLPNPPHPFTSFSWTGIESGKPTTLATISSSASVHALATALPSSHDDNHWNPLWAVPWLVMAIAILCLVGPAIWLLLAWVRQTHRIRRKAKEKRTETTRKREKRQMEEKLGWTREDWVSEDGVMRADWAGRGLGRGLGSRTSIEGGKSVGRRDQVGLEVVHE